MSENSVNTAGKYYYYAYLDISKIVCMSGPEEEVQLYGYVDVWCQLALARGLICTKSVKICTCFSDPKLFCKFESEK